MKKFGIFTATSEIWFHLHPLVPAIYYYRVAQCREFITTTSPIRVFGKSKDGTVSAAGYLIPKHSPFIRRRTLSRERVGSPESWRRLTDREAGLRGQELAVVLLRLGVFPELGMKVTVSDSQSDQYVGRDIFVGKIPSEIKTERVVSANLFVQDEEGGHRPTLLADGAEHHTVMPPFPFNVQPSLLQDE